MHPRYKKKIRLKAALHVLRGRPLVYGVQINDLGYPVLDRTDNPQERLLVTGCILPNRPLPW